MNWNSKKKQNLIKTILALESSKEAQSFFRDLLTESEINEFSNRWQAAQMLDKNIPYTKIIKDTGLSSTTVARISKWLTKGQGGYKLMLSRLANHHAQASRGKGLS